ncbi:uncharacterized protein LOC129003557 [Macrosteles quadrilineatus]|uniref:uncharacterized protein LOC129003557 n=1 Tax=Macrosteles quadrilineatus TaxID=74068 RepID=UPI0023E0D963|nr:uncharacterized protein LOC129003557 [Macrosteles quadrilineatus]
MAPVLSGLSPYEEETILKCLPTNIRVDMMTSSAAVKDGENFMSVVTRVNVIGHDLDSGDKTTFSLIMKTLPQSVERRELFFCDAAFLNETEFYSEVAPRLGGDQKIPLPQCLLAADDVIVLRDLRQDGFTTADRRAGLDLDHCLLVMKELGKFHAMSFNMKKNDPSQFAQLRTRATEVLIHEDNLILPACIDNCISMALKVTDNHDLPVVNVLKSLLGSGVGALTPHLVPQEPMAVLCHGDLWSNNLLFRYLEGFSCPVDVCFLDLQGWRYASPALDILYFLFTSGAPSCHFQRLISAYHRCLGHVTLEDIMTEVRKHVVFGLIMSLMVLPVITAGDGMAVNLDDVNQDNILEFQNKLEEGFLNASYRKRVNDIFALVTAEKLI